LRVAVEQGSSCRFKFVQRGVKSFTDRLYINADGVKEVNEPGRIAVVFVVIIDKVDAAEIG